MSIEAVIAIVVFAAMFLAWTVLPSKLKKRHEAKTEKEGAQ